MTKTNYGYRLLGLAAVLALFNAGCGEDSPIPNLLPDSGLACDLLLGNVDLSCPAEGIAEAASEEAVAAESAELVDALEETVGEGAADLVDGAADAAIEGVTEEMDEMVEDAAAAEPAVVDLGAEVVPAAEVAA